jgi:hypothetical protein
MTKGGHSATATFSRAGSASPWSAVKDDEIGIIAMATRTILISKVEEYFAKNLTIL